MGSFSHSFDLLAEFFGILITLVPRVRHHEPLVVIPKLIVGLWMGSTKAYVAETAQEP